MPSETPSKLLPALILIAVGLLFLASNLGLIKGSIGSVFSTWWPVIPLAIGIGMLLGRNRR